MPERDGYIPGVPCWVDTSQPDPEAAVDFYSGLFGWEFEDVMPPGSEGKYFIARLRGGDVAAVGSIPEAAPPLAMWNTYIWVESADQAASKVGDAGGGVVMEPFDVMDAGKMAVLQDPTGAVFQIWQPGRHIGAMILNEPGTLCWTELTTSDSKSAEKFYTQLFGWTAKHSEAAAPMEYTEFSVAGTPSIGMMPKPPNMPAHIPSYWMPYFQVDNVDASVAKSSSLAGRVMVPAQDIPNTGRFAILTDPQGAMFAVFQRS